MFVWPTVRRAVLVPILGTDLNKDGDKFDFVNGAYEYPLWLGDVIPLRDFSNHLIVEDFWATFAPWYLAIPFLGVCGFATVYFLGAKAFCSYGCPYGGFFAPVDRLAPARIRVNDNCNHCGHCTAVCTSNVRVHEEVHHYGTVIDPGCMKCLDCVSACPNDALSVGFGKPAIFTKPRVHKDVVDSANQKRARRWDMTIGEEVVIAIVFVAMVIGFRGMYGAIPLLMAMGMAGIGAFMAHKLWRLVRDANVRGPFRQLKRDGRFTAWGAAFAVASVVVIAVSVQGALMNIAKMRGELIYAQIHTPSAEVFAEKYVPKQADKELAQKAIALFGQTETAGFLAPRWGFGPTGTSEPGRAAITTGSGLGFGPTWQPLIRLSWLHAVAGDRVKSEQALRQAFAIRAPEKPLIDGLITLMVGRKAPLSELAKTFEELLQKYPGHVPVKLAAADFYLRTRQPEKAKALALESVARAPKDVPTVRAGAMVLNAVNDVAGAEKALRDGLVARPKSADLMEDLAATVLRNNNVQEAISLMEAASARVPTAQRFGRLAQLYGATNQPEKAKAAQSKAEELLKQEQENLAQQTGGATGQETTPTVHR
jgi:ferredoxin/tetratricopeptide (TPR) repeat protein